MTLVLVDTSAWIAFFRGERAAVERLDPLLAEGDAAVCGPTFAELVSGAPSPADSRRLATLLQGLEWLEPAAAIWERIAATRFALARAGKQSALLDLFIATTAADHDAELLTRDRDFVDIAAVIPLQLRRF
jgi:predicted nucleic acid-binding protein